MSMLIHLNEQKKVSGVFGFVFRMNTIPTVLVLIFSFVFLGMFSGCGSDEQFTQLTESQFFVQDFNPDYLDVLWVLDDRSPMFRIRDRLTTEATEFFKRLDQSTANYRMAVTSASTDSRFSPGALKPTANPMVLTKQFGTVEQRAATFLTLIYDVINLHTGADSNGFGAALAALKGPFTPVAVAPLVIVFISDSDEGSEVDGADVVDHYAKEYISLKNGRSDLVKIYAINYVKFPENADEETKNKFRCATLYNASIDRSGFQDRYFKMAEKFSGQKADLCGSFSGLIDLTGLALKELPSRFSLEKKPLDQSIQVTVFRDKEPVNAPPWHYEARTNEVVFDVPPPQGTTILVSYRTE